MEGIILSKKKKIQTAAWVYFCVILRLHVLIKILIVSLFLLWSSSLDIRKIVILSVVFYYSLLNESCMEPSRKHKLLLLVCCRSTECSFSKKKVLTLSNVAKWSNTLLKSCNKCCKIFNCIWPFYDIGK